MVNNERRRFLEELGAEMDAVDAQLDQYRSGFHGPGRRAASAQEIREIEQRREAIRRHSRRLEDFDGDDWLAAKQDIERARRELDALMSRSRGVSGR